MTAEIAIINRSAVALATDSAVTLRVRGAEKVYNSADKLFELSNKDPMGIMVYNNLEFMGISLEVAIKNFREKIVTEHYNSITDAAAAFFKYLQNDLTPDEEIQKNHAKFIIFPIIYKMRTYFNASSGEIYRERGKNTDYPAILHAILDHEVGRLNKIDTSECFDGKTENDFSAFYKDIFNEVIKLIFDDLPIDDEHDAKLMTICALTLMKDEYSESVTGMVFAGFGEHEKFPSLVAYKVDGIILGHLKKKMTDQVLTDRNKITGEILPFAQREMVDRFLYGVDPEFEAGIKDFLETVISSTGKAIVENIPRASKKTKNILQAAVDSATEIALKNWHEKMMPTVKNKFLQEVQDMVFLMPKQELAILAQELINLTSMKRKFSSGKETVGGPIDVAIISRIDGFVWVQRKHYFKPELNPRYFLRKFGSPAQ